MGYSFYAYKIFKRGARSMGKKYIIELESGTHIFVLGPEGIVHIGEPDVVYGTVDGMQIGDAVINAKPYTEPDLEQVRKEAYEEGFKDGQYAERNGLVANYAQVHKIKIGDEVTAEHGGSTFTVTWMSDRCICGIDSDGRCYSYMVDEVDGKTGNHHEIAAVLEKMRGEQDG